MCTWRNERAICVNRKSSVVIYYIEVIDVVFQPNDLDYNLPRRVQCHLKNDGQMGNQHPFVLLSRRELDSYAHAILIDGVVEAGRCAVMLTKG